MTENLPATTNEHGYLEGISESTQAIMRHHQDQQAQPTNMVSVESERAIAEIKAQYQVALINKRRRMDYIPRIMETCQRVGFAETAMYTFPRGGQKVSGPSIRFAEMIAKNMGNLKSGFQILNTTPAESLVRVYCTDLETNFTIEKVISVEHVRVTRKGRVELDDPRDIYELIANQSQRRARQCMLALADDDVIRDALAQCKKTLLGDTSVPIGDKVKQMVLAFKDLGVDTKMIEKFLGHDVEHTDANELLRLRGAYTSISEGASTKEKWFDMGPKESDLNEKFAAPSKEPKKEAKK